MKDESALLDQLVDDFLVNALHDTDPQTYSFYVSEAGYTRKDLRALARLATDDLDMEVIPEKLDGARLESELAKQTGELRKAWQDLDKSSESL